MTEAQTFMPLGPEVQLRVVVEAGEAPAPSAAVLRRWEEMRQAIPRLFDAPVLSVLGIDGGNIRCRRDTYKRLVVQPEVATGVEQLSVTGVLTARDDAGRRRVLLGKRSAQTRMYAGMWELGPAGGVEAPAAGDLSHADLIAELAREIREECGVDVTGVEMRPMGIVHDPVAHSFDVAMVMDAGIAGEIEPGSWEYEQVRWVRVDEIPALLRGEGEGIIAPTRVLLDAMVGRVAG